MAVTRTKKAGTTTSAERTHGSKGATWGDNGIARIPTQLYKDNLDKVDFTAFLERIKKD